MEYLDFELEIERVGKGKRFRARVIESPAGRRAHTIFQLPSTATGWEPDRDNTPRDSGDRHVSIEPTAGAAASALGQELFDCILASGPVRARWRASLEQARAEGKGLRLRLRLPEDEELLKVPWELLYDRNGSFLAQSDETPIVRSLDVAGRRRSMTVEAPVRVLALLSCPAGVVPLQVEQEWTFLEQALAPRVVGEQATLEHLARPTLPELVRYLRSKECHVLHFIGHGTCAEGVGALALENGSGEARWVDHEKLEAFLGHRALRLVVLNACEGAKPGRIDPLAGVAQSLIRQGVPAVIAMQCDVSDAVAVEFTRQFYSALAEGLPVETAMSRARQDLSATFEGVAWAIPVLYMNAREGHIWPPPRDHKSGQEHEQSFLKWLQGKGKVVLGGAALAALIGAGLLLYHQDGPARPPINPNPPECPSPPGLDMAFVRIGPGIFEMGESKGDKTDEPVHQVRITRPFCLGAFEVTQGQWNQIMGGIETPLAERYLPVGQVTYAAAQEFVRRLNDLEPSRPYRLPTEAEWEYAARARSFARFSLADTPKFLPQYANCKEKDGFDGPAPVGRFRPNDFGLYDMNGNLFEWVSDWYGEYSGEKLVDPHGPLTGSKRIRRGGSWESGSKACSSTARSDVKPDWKREDTGFRIVREIR